MCKSEIFKGWKLVEISSNNEFGYKLRQKNRGKELLNLQISLLGYIEEKVPGAKAGERNLIIKNNILDDIQNYIDSSLIQTNGYQSVKDERPISNRSKRKLRVFLRKGLAEGKNKLGWDVEIPAIEVIFHAEKNPVSPIQFSRLNRLYKQIENFDKFLTPPQNISKNHAVMFAYGQLIFSATVFSCLADPAAWLQLPFTKGKIENYQEYTWIDLFTEDFPKYTVAKKGVRRCFIDPVTLILISKLPKLTVEVKDRDALRRWLNSALQYYLKNLDLQCSGINNAPLTASQWLEIVHTYFNIIFPPYLARYCAGAVKSSAWYPETWARILKQKRPITSTVKELGTYSQHTINEDQFKIEIKQVLICKAKNEDLFKLIKLALRRKVGEPIPTFKEVRKRLFELESTFKENSNLLYCLLVWIHQRFAAKEIKQSSAYQQLTTIGRDLISYVDESVFFTLDAEQYQDIYENIIENTPSGNTRAIKASLLNRFHDFMSRQLGIVNISISTGADGLLSRPDANYLSYKEYQYLYDFLKSKKNKGPIEHIQLIILILGYRCGLRISEVKNIKLGDIQYLKMKSLILDNKIAIDKPYPTSLLIRGNQYNKLKSQNAMRQIFLNKFLNGDELNEILLFHQSQLKKIGKFIKSSYLFSISNNNNKPIDISLAQRNIHYLMRRITGDERITFHNLRHSFACNYMHEINNLDGPLKGDQQLIDSIADRRSRKNLYEFCTYLGHSSPSVSLEHYTHNLDLVLRQNILQSSFGHKISKKEVSNRCFIKHNIINCISELINVSPENQRWHKNKYGEIINWLPKKLGIQTSIQDSEWIEYDQVELDLIEQEQTRSLIDLEFEEWCSTFTGFRKGLTEKDIIKQHYLDSVLSTDQFNIIFKLVMTTTRHNNSRITSISNKVSNPYSYILKPPRAKLEKDIAKEIFIKCVKLLEDPKYMDFTFSGLQYFYENFRYWQKKVIARYDVEFIDQLKNFEKLINIAIPNVVAVTVKRNSPDSRQFNMGQITLNTGSAQAQDGPGFGLLLAYLYSKIRYTT